LADTEASDVILPPSPKSLFGSWLPGIISDGGFEARILLATKMGNNFDLYSSNGLHHIEPHLVKVGSHFRRFSTARISGWG
jgi:hypothetical protein